MYLRHSKIAICFVACLFFNTGCAFDSSNRHISSGNWSEPGCCNQFLHGNIYSRTELYFGLSNSNGVVSQEEFQHFINTEVTPRFPNGLTVINAKGQFKNSNGIIIKEDSNLLILFYIFNAERNACVEQIRDAYKKTFQQESVMRVDEQSCVSF
jgi:hypothetical protein